MPSLRIEAVAKHFGGLRALDDVTMTVPAGEITGLIGPNGAGKSTLVNLIGGLLSLTKGKIFLDDRPIDTLSAFEIARLGVTRTFQNIRLLPEATVLENVMIGFHRREQAGIVAGLLGLPSAFKETRTLRQNARTLLKRFDMEEYAEHEASKLSYGHQRRVEIMRAIASDPCIVMLDEPVAGMNEVESNELGIIFRDLAASGVGLLLIEHDLNFVMRTCRKVYVLDSGRLIAEGSPEEVVRDPNVIAAYVGTGAKAA